MCDIGKLRMHFRRCENQDVCVVINVKGEMYDICHACWKRLADKDINWGDEGISEGILDELETNGQKPILGDDDEKS